MTLYYWEVCMLMCTVIICWVLHILRFLEAGLMQRCWMRVAQLMMRPHCVCWWETVVVNVYMVLVYLGYPPLLPWLLITSRVEAVMFDVSLASLETDQHLTTCPVTHSSQRCFHLSSVMTLPCTTFLIFTIFVNLTPGSVPPNMKKENLELKENNVVNSKAIMFTVSSI